MTEKRVSAGGFTPDCFATFTRPADTNVYAAGDMVANSTTGASVVPLRFPALRVPNGSGVITGGRIIKSDDDLVSASFRLWVFSKQPFAAAGYPADNAALTLTYAAMQNFVGMLDFTSFIDAGSANVAVANPTRNQMPFSCARAQRMPTDDAITIGDITYNGTQLLYGVLEARAAYTPASAEQFTVWLDVQQD